MVETYALGLMVASPMMCLGGGYEGNFVPGGLWEVGEGKTKQRKQVAGRPDTETGCYILTRLSTMDEEWCLASPGGQPSGCWQAPWLWGGYPY